jgi:hypothetical protein
MIDRVSTSVVQGIVDDVASWGRHGVETGGFILTRADPRLGDTVILCGETGITRRPDQLVISGEALAVLFDYAAEHDMVVACQIHSHQFGPRMSPTDQRFGLTVEGFTSVIVPRWSAPSIDPGDWGWWRFTEGRWLAAGAPHSVEAEAMVLVFDERGVQNV